MPGLIIVSNRLPVSVKREGGKLEFHPSAGGLPTALASYAHDRGNKWIGWPGIASDELSEKDRQYIAGELEKNNCYPVFLTQKQIDEYYSGYSNSVLWPVFHDSEIGEAAQGAKQARLWKAYERVNRLFAEVVLALSGSGDTIWVHDYQLLVLPALLRLERPYDKIGFFLHIPFPPPEQFAKIADGEALLAGMLGAGLIGLHIENYVGNLLETVNNYDLGIVQRRKVILQDRVVRVTDFPIGIDYAKYEKARESSAVSREYAKLRLQYAGLKVILTVDRLDPAKGLVERALAYQSLLRENPKLRGHVVMVMVVVHTRPGIAEYEQLKQRLESIINETNKEFGLLPWVPIEYIPHALPFEQLTALYRRANVAFITPLRDGMNLVAKEYLASKPYQRGVLVLSRTAGAAQELKDAVMVDPKSPASLVKGLAKALDMRPTEFKRRVRRMQRQLASANVQTWAKSFTKALKQETKLTANRTASLSAAQMKPLIQNYKNATRRLLLLDYDGVLAPIVSRPEDAKPTPELRMILNKLGDTADIVIISGRDRESLGEWLGDLPVNLVAEHGVFTKPAGNASWETTPSTALPNWQDIFRPVLEKYAGKTPGAFVEAKSSALVWHYRKASPYYAQKHLVTLRRVLKPLGKKYGIEVRQGKKILELRANDVNKGTSAVNWVEKTLPDFILALGDDYTDEDMFTRLPANACTIRVGRGQTAARYRLKNTEEVLSLLQKLAKF